jgi:tRNA pseudouridine38-40 synthase
VQETLAEAIATMAGAPVEVRGASRTDAGVHALGQLAAFDTARDIPPDGWVKGLNAALPPDVAVRDATPCEPGYEPRFDAKDKLYRYVLYVGRTRDPLLRHRAWYVKPSLLPPPSRVLDLDAMRRAASALVGTHDFRAFRAADDERESTERTLVSVELVPGWAGDARQLAIEVRGTAFMKQMVRIITGTLVEIGRGRMSPDVVEALFESGDRSAAGPTAPPEGLTLVEIRRRTG